MSFIIAFLLSMGAWTSTVPATISIDQPQQTYTTGDEAVRNHTIIEDDEGGA